MSTIHPFPLSRSPDLLASQPDADRARPQLEPVLYYLALLALFATWAGFWFGVIWFIA